jgi:hypothetical protein
LHAEEINKKISELNQISWFKLCCFNKKKELIETNLNDENQLLILPFPNLNNSMYGLNELEKDFDFEKFFNSINNSYSEFLTKDDFEKILHEEYKILFELAKKLTKVTLEHMQLAQPRMRQLLEIKAPSAFAQVQKDFMI